MKKFLSYTSARMLWLQSVREELIEKVNALYNNEKKLHGVRHFSTVTFFAVRTVLYCDFFLKLTISLIKLIQKTHKKRSVMV